MKTADLQNLTHAELQKQLDAGKEELFNLRFQIVTNQLDNTARIKDVRHQVARVKTVMRQQEIAVWKSQQEEA
ncbi:MAG TPA: 50S ribosomal protein L29 [Acidimicrobiia bacterium]|nr:50S ribosomal protein L29 [Acidimicrobiia bacterium]